MRSEGGGFRAGHERTGQKMEDPRGTKPWVYDKVAKNIAPKKAKLASADRITFRRAPFHQGWTRVDSEAMEPAAESREEESVEVTGPPEPVPVEDADPPPAADESAVQDEIADSSAAQLEGELAEPAELPSHGAPEGDASEEAPPGGPVVVPVSLSEPSSPEEEHPPPDGEDAALEGGDAMAPAHESAPEEPADRAQAAEDAMAERAMFDYDRLDAEEAVAEVKAEVKVEETQPAVEESAALEEPAAEGSAAPPESGEGSSPAAATDVKQEPSDPEETPPSERLITDRVEEYDLSTMPHLQEGGDRDRFLDSMVFTLEAVLGTDNMTMAFLREVIQHASIRRIASEVLVHMDQASADTRLHEEGVARNIAAVLHFVSFLFQDPECLEFLRTQHELDGNRWRTDEDWIATNLRIREAVEGLPENQVGYMEDARTDLMECEEHLRRAREPDDVERAAQRTGGVAFPEHLHFSWTPVPEMELP